MRRSKSNPARYVKHYHKLSQRRMIDDDDDDETISMTVTPLSSQTGDRTTTEVTVETEMDHATTTTTETATDGLLSAELLEEYGEDDVAIRLSSKKKKKRSLTDTSTTNASSLSATTPSDVVLTPMELKQAAAQRKQQTRKLQQLMHKRATTERRANLYQSLHQSSVSNETRQLLNATAHWSKPLSKQDRVVQIQRRERAGLVLTEHEHDVLHRHSNQPHHHHHHDQLSEQQRRNTTTGSSSTTTDTHHSTTETSTQVDVDQNKSPPKKKLKRHNDLVDATAASAADGSTGFNATALAPILASATTAAEAVPPPPPPQPSGRFVATQLLASMISLHKKTTDRCLTDDIGHTVVEESTASTKQLDNDDDDDDTPLDSTKSAISTTIPSPKIIPYVPLNPVAIHTTQSYDVVKPPPGTEPPNATNQYHQQQTAATARMLRSIQRPAAVTTTRLHLPVVAMEFDIVDAVRNNDVTIVCASTGSGKSTQVPQFLYEAGDSLVVDVVDDKTTTGRHQDPSKSKAPGISYLVGVTQPRRVAAVSTAKRVCYELGFGSGFTISSNNVVAYQTRHETAGLGTNTRVKFMTDGILLQEIQSDLLLRKYTAIVLDEAHERNLNTDVLLGLLSAALPLRRAASMEDPTLPPLKVVIMSATLRVKDFTENPRLFATPIKTMVVNVSGRTFPVTIHHSKVTELDSYEEAAFQKTIKIHKKLPEGGILIFLTGRQEIIRMVNRLRSALKTKETNDVMLLSDPVASTDPNISTSEDIPRGMDDDEADGDIFQSSNEPDDFDDTENDAIVSEHSGNNDDKETDALKAIVRPLFSLLSTEDQAHIFAPVPKGFRLIVVATNIAETSITIPGITYVVDPGRQKCRNYHAETGVASYDIMWISKAAADQRAGRAGRTGPGHCYRLYSSSLYTRQMDQFGLPEVLTRPLEDIVLAMKSMKVSNVAEFPFPTPPDRSQVDAAAKLLANLGCLDMAKVEECGGDGEITRLGMAVSKLPLGVRCSKILLVAAEAGVLDYAISVVAALSESNPFVNGGQSKLDDNDEAIEDQDIDVEVGMEGKKPKPFRWAHKNGDLLAAMLAVGAYAFAGCDSGKGAGRQFCETNGLHPVVMERIQKLRSHLCRLSKTRLGSAQGVAASTGGFVQSMRPPNKLHEILLCQSIASGFLDNIAFLAPLGSIPGQHPYSLRSAYLSCSSSVKEPLFMDRNSVVYSRDARQLPKWICYETLLRKSLKDGTPIAVMKNVTPIDPSWLGRLADGSRLLKIGEPIPSPLPVYDANRDAVLCSVKTLYGNHAWEVPSAKRVMFDALHNQGVKQSGAFLLDDSFRWFGRFLLAGEVFAELKDLKAMLNDDPSIMTRKTPAAKVALLVSALSGSGIDSAAALRKHWAEVDDKFIFGILKRWAKPDRTPELKHLWVSCVKTQVRVWNASNTLAPS